LAVLATFAGSASAQQVVVLGDPGWGTGFGFEPYVGRLEFDKKMRLPTQDVVGGLAGLYLGRHSTLRGYYWAGTDSDSTGDANSKRMESFGGEFEFSLPTGIIHPFFVAGGGRLNYVDGFTDLDSLPRENQASWVVGAGLAVRPLPWLDVKVGYRNTLLKYPLGTSWLSNSLFTLGASFRIGGTPSKQQTAMYGAAAAGSATAAAAAAGNMASFPVPVGGGEIKVVYNGDTLRANGTPASAATIATGTATVAAVRDLVSSELAYLNALYPLPFGAKRTELTPEQADSLTRRIGLRSNGVFDYIMQGQAEAIHASLISELTARGVDTATQRQVLARVDSALTERLVLNAAQSRAIMIRNDSAYARAAREAAAAGRHTVTAGIGGFSAFYLQGRVSFPTQWNQRLRLAPEVALGFLSGGVTSLVAGNALYYVPTSGSAKPYFGLGLGVLVRGDSVGGESGTSFVVNPVLGLELTSASAKVFGKGATGYFIEVEGVNLFSDTRLLAGITWKF
jgi:hypothetical protein